MIISRQLGNYHTFIACINSRHLNIYDGPQSLRRQPLKNTLFKFNSTLSNSSAKIPSSKFLCQVSNETDLKYGGIRHKSKGRKKKIAEESSDDDSDEDEEDEWSLESGPDFKDIKVMLQTLRLDAVIKSGLKLSRHQVEEIFYGNKIQVNSQRATKKSIMIHERDEVDVLRKESSDSENKVFSRLILRKIGNFNENSDKVPVIIRRYPNLIKDD